jgi:ABC-type uncharacterized transport system ATPase subunit
MLVKSNLKREIKDLQKELIVMEDQEEAMEKYAEKLATIIHNYIKTALVTVTIQVAPGQVVQTIPSTGTGSTTSAGTGTGTGSLS